MATPSFPLSREETAIALEFIRATLEYERLETRIRAFQTLWGKEELYLKYPVQYGSLVKRLKVVTAREDYLRSIVVNNDLMGRFFAQTPMAFK